jgi:hypothetical protein
MESSMRKILICGVSSAMIAAVIATVPSLSQAQPYYGGGMMGGYGGYGMMGGGYGYGPGMMNGYGGDGYGPGMMYGYGPNGERYYSRGGQHYRGKQLCWHQTGADQNSGYYGACPK